VDPDGRGGREVEVEGEGLFEAAIDAHVDFQGVLGGQVLAGVAVEGPLKEGGFLAEGDDHGNAHGGLGSACVA
jgi:hypothetical protein